MTESNDLIEIEFGEDTEALGQQIISDIADEALDAISIRRVVSDAIDLASEPTTIMIAFTGLSIVHICACISRYLEGKRQKTSAEMVLRAYTTNNECGEAMVRLQSKHADLIRYSPLPAPSLAQLPKRSEPVNR